MRSAHCGRQNAGPKGAQAPISEPMTSSHYVASGALLQALDAEATLHYGGGPSNHMDP